jgi:hypothetical protein
MPERFLPFDWFVPEQGYRWTPSEEVPDRQNRFARILLSELHPVSADDREKPVDPMSRPTLYAEFASIPTDARSVISGETSKRMLSFANRYGLLMRARSRSTGGYIGDARQSEPLPESLHGWLGAVRLLSGLLELWRSATAADSRSLRETVSWADRAIVLRRRWCGAKDFPPVEHLGIAEPLPTYWDKAGVIISSPEVNPDILAAVPELSVIAPAKMYIQRWINAALRDNVVPQLASKANNPPLFGIRFIPGNLFGALWLQFAMTVSGEQRFGQCKHCGKWYAAGTGERVRDYCKEGTCRQLAYYYRRKAKANSETQESAASDG